MHLFDLPLDVFRNILQQVVIDLNTNAAVIFRLVNDLFRKEIDEALIATKTLHTNYFRPRSYNISPSNLDFFSRYLLACTGPTGTGQPAFKVHGGLLDVIEYTTAQLMADPKIKESMRSRDILLGLCRMVLQALGFNRALRLISWERENQEAVYARQMESDKFYTAAYLLPAAIYLKMASTTDRLLEQNLDLNVESRYFWTPLCAAAFTGQEDLVQSLLNKNADPYYGPQYRPSEYESFGWKHITEQGLIYAPRAAAVCGHNNIIEKLFKQKHPSNTQRAVFWSFVMAAVRSGGTESIQTISRYDPSLLSSSKVKEFIMYEACAKGHTTIVKAMLEAGTSMDIFSISPYDNGPWHNNRECMDPLKIAASFGHLETVRLLLEYGAPLQRSKERGSAVWNTALGLAAQNGFLQVTELLIKHGADVNAGRRKPLSNACRRGQAHIVKFMLQNERLLDGGRDSNKRCSGERLWNRARFAIERGFPSVAETLREFGIPETPA